MARKNQHTFSKRQREHKKAEKAAEKQARRDARKNPESLPPIEDDEAPVATDDETSGEA